MASLAAENGDGDEVREAVLVVDRDESDDADEPDRMSNVVRLLLLLLLLFLCKFLVSNLPGSVALISILLRFSSSRQVLLDVAAAPTTITPPVVVVQLRVTVCGE